MKITFLITLLLLGTVLVLAQASSSQVEIVTTYSQNEKFFLKSIPYDTEFPTTRGKTSVYESGNAAPLYVFDRGFDSVQKDSNNLILSNDGEVIFYVIPWAANDSLEGLKSITIYQHGKILKSFTETEITGCDRKRERCSLVYSNYNEVVDREKSHWGTRSYKKALKDGVSEKDRFLSDFPIFSFGDMVYLTDSKRRVHRFDLKQGSYLGFDSFEDLFDRIKNQGRFNRTELEDYQAPLYSDFPKLKNGGVTAERLAQYLGMMRASIFETKDEQYKLYSFKLNSTISRDGTLAIENIEFWGGALPHERVVEFFKSNRFDSSAVPAAFDQWNLGDEYFYFRKTNSALARREKREEIQEHREEWERRLTLETIAGVYIPKDLGECFVELDKLLAEVDKKEMQALPKRNAMIKYHLSLGMWMRNNWGLHGGSRQYKYFRDKGLNDPEDMSTVVLYHYHDWLHGMKETWRDWEKSPKRSIE